VEVAISLNLEADKAIRCHYEYFMLLGCTEFTKVYLQIKDNPWPYVSLTRLIHEARIGDSEVVELLRIANGYLPRIILEYDRVKEEIKLSKAELNSWKAATSNEARVYQDFCDRNPELKKREDELQQNIDEMENKKAEIQKATTDLPQHLAELQENNTYCNNLNLEVKQDGLSLPGVGSRKIYDTAEISDANLPIHNIMFQEYPEPASSTNTIQQERR